MADERDELVNGIRINASVSERMMKYTSVGGEGECWVWNGYRDRQGYGMLKVFVNGAFSHRKASQISYIMSFGAIPTGKLVCHTCDNKSCVNPAHLYAGSASDNIRDRMVRQGMNRGEHLAWSKITENDVREIRRLFPIVGRAALAKMFRLSPQHVSKVARRLEWRHVV